ncbi:MAG: phosphopyruvate hydratase [Candidatus Dependentiae bacterium]|nr:phosphopyruvate hydratase [Candidatus Dependentiae bacterium]
MKIKEVLAREIYDSRGWPTVECELILDNHVGVKASAPSGLSIGKHEAVALMDKGSRLMGHGVLKAVENIQTKIAPLLIGQEPNVVQFDTAMIELDGTENKSVLGANAMIAASMAVCKAQAVCEDMELYELIAYLCGFEEVTLPGPMFNLINGGMHADTSLQIQEFMIVPIGMGSFRAAVETGVMVFHILKQLLQQQGKYTSVGDEGGFAPNAMSDIDALDCLMTAIDIVQKECNGTIMIALDVAASRLYDPHHKMYNWQGKKVLAEELISWYEKITQQYPIYSIEDGLAEHDWANWTRLSAQFESKVRIVGDDIFATHSQLIWEGIQHNSADTVLIKPNQVGTITETLQAIKLCKEHSLNTIVSHRSGETNDTFIADLAIGISANHIKAGSCSRGERMAKYNRILRIEEQLLYF